MTTKVFSGARVRRIRERFNLSVDAWARLMGVSVSTAYRWEAAGKKTIDCFQRELLAIFEQLPKQDLSERIVKEAPLYLLWELLGHAFKKRSSR